MQHALSGKIFAFQTLLIVQHREHIVDSPAAMRQKRYKAVFPLTKSKAQHRIVSIEREQATKEYIKLPMARVGLLEDNPVLAKLAATMLNLTGHHVTIYEHPRQFLHALSLAHMPHNLPSGEETALPLELLILDLHLPEIGGFQILELLQKNQQTRLLPLIFLTAATSREIDYAMHLAPQAYLIEKPFKMETLLSAVTRMLQAQ